LSFGLDKLTSRRMIRTSVVDNEQFTHKETGECPAGNKRTGRLRANADEADNQQLTPKWNVPGPILDKLLAIA
jgi:hypothetical protein